MVKAGPVALKRILGAFLIMLLLRSINSIAQTNGHGTIVHLRFVAASIKGNPAGENALRRVSIYLPPGYDKSSARYPVVYCLHAYDASDSTSMIGIGEALDDAITTHQVRPMIMVMPDSETEYRGSFYTNSSFTGKWADYIAKDVVELIDSKYRTIKSRDGRGITGLSMGGNGALKIAMLFSDVFSCVYAMTPAVLNWSDGVNIGIPAFKLLSAAKSKKEVMDDFRCRLMVDLGRTYSPDKNKPPFYADMPAYYVNNSLVVDLEVKKKWEENFPTRMIEHHLAALKSLKAIKLDWGRNDENKHVPVTCLEFSKQLEQFGIKHFAEEYLGGHAGNLSGRDGRLYTEVFPFFNTYLNFE
ncbi:alpha/beta hydrolase [Chitinophaga sp. LS1]|uniref:alpha/beta hydrolase n=1 Tax=Chitinophaga sp. LS1 TaxID=3051176 RepID=UPI002AAB1906|nr:alpha/beta hydrolase-fold protein [Chitinophaga sp. LS1]WPV66541.1 alpha/beta hydrolase-fold protein [Chitinophaga sp. LS1]